MWDLCAAALVLLVLLLAYSHTGHLLFHTVVEGYRSVSSACLSLLGSGGRGLFSWRPAGVSNVCSASCFAFHVSFASLRFVLLWLITSVLLRNYRRVRAELYRPVVDLQDYEMVELFLRRLKMWMGLSRTKEFRHKVRFEGMELPPSRSSSTSDCRSLCLPPLDAPDPPPTPDSVDGGSEASWLPTSSSPCSLPEVPGLTQSLGLGVVPGGQVWKERAEAEATLRRVLPAFDALLLQLDRVNEATEELYSTECQLEKVQRRCRGRSLKEEQDHGCKTLGKKKHKGGCHTHRDEEDADTLEKTPQNHEEGSDAKLQCEGSAPREEPTSKDPERLEAHKQVPKTTPSSQNIDPEPIQVEESAVKIETSGGGVEYRPRRRTKGFRKTASNRRRVDPDVPKDPENVESAVQPGRPQPQTPMTSSLNSCATPPSTASSLTTATPVPIPRPLAWNPLPSCEDLPSSLFQHPAHTSTMPTRKRKHKPPSLKNKIHPNPDRPVSGH